MVFLFALGTAVIVALLPLAFSRSGRSYYPHVLSIIALFYVVFAATAGDLRLTLIEAAIATTFVIVAVVGYLRNLYLIALALVIHGFYDLVHGILWGNESIPQWWPTYCAVVDILLGGWLALLTWRKHSRLTSPD